MTTQSLIETAKVHPDTPPLRVDAGGVIRVGDSRISLDQVVHHFESGAAVEDIVRAFDTLSLADVYGAIAYYLRHRTEVAAYITARVRQSAELRQLVESKHPTLTKLDLLSRKNDTVHEHVTSSD